MLSPGKRKHAFCQVKDFTHQAVIKEISSENYWNATPDVWTDFDILHNNKLKAEIQKQREKN